MGGWRTGACVAAAIACVATAAPARAQSREQSREAERSALFRDGSAAASEGRWADAAERFEKVVAIRSAPKALIALGIADEHLGRLVAAKHAYERARSDARAAGLGGDEATADRALALLAPRIPRLRLAGAEAARVVVVDGEEVTGGAREVEVDPGDREVDATAADGRTFRARVHARESEAVDVVVDFGRAPEEARAVGEPAASAADPRSVEQPPAEGQRGGPPAFALVTLGLGVAAAGTGVALWAMGRGEEDDVRALCRSGTSGCPLSAQPEVDASRTKILAGDVVFGVGAAAVVAGVVWWWLGARAPAARSPASAFVAAPVPGGAYLGVRGAL